MDAVTKLLPNRLPGAIKAVRRVLIVSYYFPPRPGVASLRLRGLAKYLPEFGWEPVILTAKLPGVPEPQYHVIETSYPGDAVSIWKGRLGLAPDKMFQEQIGIPRALREDRNSFTGRAVNLARGVIAYPDDQKHWYPVAVREGDELLKNRRFDALLSSSGPVTCHLIAKELKKKHGIPWVADFRDLWTQNHYYPYVMARLLIERRLEINTLSDADHLVTVSEPLAQKLRLLHRGKPVTAILNGYDPDEAVEGALTKEFTITYAGQLYQGKRDPAPLFRAIAELITERRLDRRDVKVCFYGASEYWLERDVKRFALEDLVSLYPRVPRNEVLNMQRESQILLLLNWDDPKEIGVYTGKVFEYLAARRPILSVGGPKSVVAELLEETDAGIYVAEYLQIKHALIKFYEQYKAYGYIPYKGREERIDKYSHREMARRFAVTLNLVVAKE